MNRFFSLLSTIPILAVAASAQCFEPNFGTLAPLGGTPFGYGDDLLFDVVPMNITFPIGGVTPTYTHAHISSNGVIYLTNGAPSGGSSTGYPPQVIVRGALGAPPRIAPMWCDLDNLATNGGGVFFNNTLPGKFVVTWRQTAEWNAPLPVFTVQAQLFSNGTVVFTYAGNVQTTRTVAFTAISAGNNVGNAPFANFAGGPATSTAKFIWEQHAPGAFDLAGLSLSVAPSGNGFASTPSPCTTALHAQYGTGCYRISDSLYQLLPFAATAPTLNNQSMTLSIAAGTYFAAWGGGAYVPPSPTATSLVLADDAEINVPLSVSMPTPSGPINSVYVHSNGMVSHGANDTITPNSYSPNAAGFLNAPATGWFSWHDYNPAEVGSGSVKTEQVAVGLDQVLFITWDGVESQPATTANPSTLQFQLNLTTGTVTYVWDNMASTGNGHLIGWSPGSASLDTGSVSLAATLPVLIPTGNSDRITLSAAPVPVSTPTTGTLVTFTTSNMQEYSLGGGVWLGLHCISFGVSYLPGGFELSGAGAPNCYLYILSFDIINLVVGFTPVNTNDIAVPPAAPIGFEFYSQTIGLIAPNSLPNGENAAGLTFSNGVRSVIAPY